MATHAYLDWNATAHAAAAGAGRHDGGAGRDRQSVVGPCRRPRRAPSGGGRARAGRGAGRRRGRAMSCSPRAAPRPTCWRCRPRSATTLLVSAIEHPSVRSGGRFAAAEEIPVTAAGVVDLAALERLLAGRVAAAGLADARQQRDRRDPAGRGGGGDRACRRRAPACRCGAGPGPDCLRFQGARRRSDDAVGAQDRRSAGRRRADQARRPRCSIR